MKHKLGATFMWLALMATSCGGSETSTLNSEEAGDVSATQEQAEQSSAIAPDTNVDKTDSNVEPASPDADIDEVYASAEPEDKAETVQLIMAVANGPETNDEMDHLELETHYVDGLGPTDDLAGTLARYGPTPEDISTLPDTVMSTIYSVRGRNQPQPDDELVARDTIHAEFFTSISSEYAISIYKNQLSTAGWEVSKQATEQTDGLLVHSVNAEHPSPSYSRLSIDSFGFDSGETLVVFNFAFEWDDGRAPSSVGSSWHGDSPFPEDGLHSHTYIRVDARADDVVRVTMSTAHTYWNVSNENIRAETLAVVDRSEDWQVTDERHSSKVIVSFHDGFDDEASIRFSTQSAGEIFEIGYATVEASYTRLIS